ncbi:MAG: VWA domain-containing protein [Comamonas sp.]|nr:VWA domain-containing protein [Candidatus Comamonas equi]
MPRTVHSLCIAAGWLALSAVPPAWAQNAKPLLQEGKKTLYQRVLTTPGCYLSSTAKGAKTKELLPFNRYYVYARQGQGADAWLHVGPDSVSKPVGWMPAGCAVDWNMQLSLAFTNPAGRPRLMFFKDKERLQKILNASDPAREVAPLRSKLAKNQSTPDVLAQEPANFIDMQKQFYLLPILSGQEVMTEAGFYTRLLHVASVSKASAQGAAGANAPAAANKGNNQIKEFRAAVVFVIDASISMDPYIERTREAIRKVYEQLGKEKLENQVRFGLVGFRSSTKAVPGLEYVTKMYADPNQVMDGKAFMDKASQLQQAKVSSKEFDEDAYAGVMQAIEKIDWSDFGARYVVLITDAGAIDGASKLSSTGLNAQQVRIEAGKPGVAIYTLHLKTPSGAANHAKAQSQYSALSTYAGTNTSLYYPVNAGDVKEFGAKVDALASALTTQVKNAYLGEQAIGSAQNAKGVRAQDKQMFEDADIIGHAMRLAYLGQRDGTQAPNVFKAWIADRDLIKQNVPTTDVRVLLTKAELSNLSDVTRKVLEASNKGLISPNDMFSSLRSIAATMSNDPSMLNQKNTTGLAKSGVMGEFLDGLPYQSEVLNLDEETWKGWNALQQEQFTRNLRSKLRLYERFNADVDRWVALSPDAAASEKVYPVPLEMLP